MSIITQVLIDEDTTIVRQFDKTDRFIIRGSRMYTQGIEDLIDILSKDELKQFLSMVKDTKNYNKFNILIPKWKDLFTDMKPVAKSRLKKKLLDNYVIAEYNKKFMINPFVSLPSSDKNIRNSQYLTQQAFTKLFRNKDLVVDGVDEFINYIFS